jgi:hypothetical protein
MLKLGSQDNKKSTFEMMFDGEEDTTDMDMDFDHYLLFKNSIRSPLLLVKYQARLNAFFDFICIPNSPINERCNFFIKNCQQNVLLHDCFVALL